jgi:SAM-dependent methyltransferase
MIKNNNPEINVEELMQRIRAEVAQRRSASSKAENRMAVDSIRFAAGVGNTSGEELPAFTLNLPELSAFAVQPVFHSKADGKYHVNDLLCYYDQAFVNIAYRTVLRRAPDTDGYLHYLNMLRKGFAKVDILGRLRYAKEGRATGIKISGLALPFLLQQVYRIPVFGRFVHILSAIWHLPHLERNQRTFENHTILLMEQAQSHFIRQLQAFAASWSHQTAINEANVANFTLIQKRVEELKNSKANQVDLNTAIEKIQLSIQDSVLDLQNSKDAHLAFEAEQTQTRSALDALKQNVQQALNAAKNLHDTKVDQSALDEALILVKTQTQDIKCNLLDQDRRLGFLLEEARKHLPEPISHEQIEPMLTEAEHRFDAMYASFEDRFRGTREDIKQRQSIYLPIVLEAKAGTKDAPILDLGCGRGEWLEFLHHEGRIARGVDINRVFLAGCRELELDVVEQDAVEYLRTLKPKSVGAVTAFHLIEHLPLKTLVALIDESLRVLKPGGLVILETPNPENVLVGSLDFYFDPTHRNPLPGPLTQFLLEARGFSSTRFMPLHPCESSDRLTEGSPQMQRVFNQFFFGPQDYAVVAYKPKS